MAKLIALEWDTTEARVVVGRANRGSDLVVERAFTVELGTGDEQATPDEAELATRLAEALRAMQLGRGDALVAVGRASIELRRLQLPPAPDEELPDLVRFQAMRQFTTIGDQWPIDFAPLSRSDTSVDVLAAAISPQLVENIRQACTAAELNPRHLVLRPFATASLLMRSSPQDTRCRMIVDVLTTEADLTVVSDGKVAFVRTVRLPRSEGVTAAQIAAIVGEVRRTLPAAQSQLGRRIEAVTVCGDGSAFEDLRASIEKQLALPIEFFNPFSAVKLSSQLKSELPGFSGRYAPLLGMLVDAAEAAPQIIDFLHPRQRPKPTSNRQRRLAWATALVTAACLFAIVLKVQLNARDREIAKLRNEQQSSKTVLDEAKKNSADLEQLQKFLTGNIPWIQELERLSVNMPSADDAIVTQLSATLQPTGIGEITFDAKVRSPGLVSQIETDLRSPRHRVTSGYTTEDPSATDFPWLISETVFVDPTEPMPKPADVATSPSSDVTGGKKETADDAADAKEAPASLKSPAEVSEADAVDDSEEADKASSPDGDAAPASNEPADAAPAADAPVTNATPAENVPQTAASDNSRQSR